MLLVNVPVPVAAVVVGVEIVGFADVFQQTPRDVIAARPSDVTFPPLLAVVAVMLLTVEVAEIVGVAALGVEGSFFLQLSVRINTNIIATKGKIQLQFFFFIII